jgi:hypothetical protein
VLELVEVVRKTEDEVEDIKPMTEAFSKVQRRSESSEGIFRSAGIT